MPNFPTVLGAAVLLLLGATTTALGQFSGADAPCQPVQAALNALDHTSRVRTTAVSIDDKPSSVEWVYVGDTIYYGDPSGHMKTAQTQAELVKGDTEGGWTLSGCRRVGSESVHGDAATVYEVHMESKNPKTQSDNKFWISAKSGLPLRRDSQTGRNGAKSSMLLTYGADIRAPNR
jgi:hypothetical protein